MNEITMGFAQVDITPTASVELAGFTGRTIIPAASWIRWLCKCCSGGRGRRRAV